MIDGDVEAMHASSDCEFYMLHEDGLTADGVHKSSEKINIPKTGFESMVLFKMPVSLES